MLLMDYNAPLCLILDDDMDAALDRAMRSAVVIKANIRQGKESEVFTECGVAVCGTKAVAALHGRVAEGSRVSVVTRTGAQLSGTVGFMRYSPGIVDIAVIDLDDGQIFKIFTPPSTEPVRLRQKLVVVGLEANFEEDFEVVADVRQVIAIPSGSSLVHCAYYRYTDTSGAGVVTVRMRSELLVVGPHVAAKCPLAEEGGDEPQRKKTKKVGEVKVHSAHCEVCEVARVEGLAEYLSGEETRR
jgi:hypothetical protein